MSSSYGPCLGRRELTEVVVAVVELSRSWSVDEEGVTGRHETILVSNATRHSRKGLAENMVGDERDTPEV